MTRRAARRRRWKLAIVVFAIVGACVAWWWHGGGRLPGFAPRAEAPPAPVTTVVLPIAPATVSVVPQRAPPAPASAPTPNPESTQDQIAELDAAQARDEAWAVARRESIRVQQRLREEAAQQRARALETDDGIRCIEGRRMRRVSNGWVDAGTC